MAEGKETPVQGVQAGSIQEDVAVNKSLREGLQNLDLERKGYQTTDAPPPQSPPQSISGIFPYEEVLAAPPSAPASAPAPVTSTQTQASNTEATGESK
jgi:hypothetical protein